MGGSNARRLGTLPNAIGTLTRLAYAQAKSNGVETRALLADSHINRQANQQCKPQA